MTVNMVQNSRPLMSPRFCEEKCGNFRSGSLSSPNSRSLICWQIGCCWGLQASDADGGCTSKMVLTWVLAGGLGDFSLKKSTDWQFGCMPPSGEWLSYLKRCLRICGQIMRPACPICLLPSVVWTLLGPDVTQT